MPCTNPRQASRSVIPNSSGKFPLKFSKVIANKDVHSECLKDYFSLPCGQCISCKLSRSREWATRIVHEASLYSQNSFLTLTYNNDYLPENLSLDKDVIPKFLKRLRDKYTGIDTFYDYSTDSYVSSIRNYYCGEYGDTYKRPHYHVLLFNFQFDDLVLFKVENGVKLYTSEKLQKLWKFGFVTVGDLTFESAAYVARYCTKKITGSDAKEHYGDRLPEFAYGSLKPGIGFNWYKKFKNDVYPHDFVVVTRGGKPFKMRPPRYYDKKFEEDYPLDMEALKSQRLLYSDENNSKYSVDKLNAIAYVQNQNFNKLVRTLDAIE